MAIIATSGVIAVWPRTFNAPIRGRATRAIDAETGNPIGARAAKIAIAGRLTRADGTPVGDHAAIQAFRLLPGVMSGGASAYIPVQPDGTFSTALIPGSYQLLARLRAVRPIDLELAALVPGLDYMMWDEGSTRIEVGTTPLSDVSVVSVPGGAITGRVVFEGDSALPPPSARFLRLFTHTYGGDHDCIGGFGSHVDLATRTFVIVNMRGRCEVADGAVLWGPWRIKSVRQAGQAGHEHELVGQSIDFDNGRTWRDVEVVLTDR